MKTRKNTNTPPISATAHGRDLCKTCWWYIGNKCEAGKGQYCKVLKDTF